MLGVNCNQLNVIN